MKNIILKHFNDYKGILFLISLVVIPSILLVWYDLEMFKILSLISILMVVISLFFKLLEYLFYYFIYRKIVFENLSIIRRDNTVEIRIIYEQGTYYLRGVFIGEFENSDTLKDSILNILNNDKELRRSLRIILRNEERFNLKLTFYVEDVYIILSTRNNFDKAKTILKQMTTDTEN